MDACDALLLGNSSRFPPDQFLLRLVIRCEWVCFPFWLSFADDDDSSPPPASVNLLVFHPNRKAPGIGERASSFCASFLPRLAPSKRDALPSAFPTVGARYVLLGHAYGTRVIHCSSHAAFLRVISLSRRGGFTSFSPLELS